MIEGFVASRYALSASLFIAIYIVSTAFSVPGATVLTLAGGFFFGVLPATVYVNIGATIGPPSRSSCPATLSATGSRRALSRSAHALHCGDRGNTATSTSSS